jgi:hypothetical protein
MVDRLDYAIACGERLGGGGSLGEWEAKGRGEFVSRSYNRDRK